MPLHCERGRVSQLLGTAVPNALKERKGSRGSKCQLGQARLDQAIKTSGWLCIQGLEDTQDTPSARRGSTAFRRDSQGFVEDSSGQWVRVTWLVKSCRGVCSVSELVLPA